MIADARAACADCLPQITVRQGRGRNGPTRVAIVGHAEGCPALSGDLPKGTNAVTIMDSDGIVLHYFEIGASA